MTIRIRAMIHANESLPRGRIVGEKAVIEIGEASIFIDMKTLPDWIAEFEKLLENSP